MTLPDDGLLDAACGSRTHSTLSNAANQPAAERQYADPRCSIPATTAKLRLTPAAVHIPSQQGCESNRHTAGRAGTVDHSDMPPSLPAYARRLDAICQPVFVAPETTG